MQKYDKYDVPMEIEKTMYIPIDDNALIEIILSMKEFIYLSFQTVNRDIQSEGEGDQAADDNLYRAWLRERKLTPKYKHLIETVESFTKKFAVIEEKNKVVINFKEAFLRFMRVGFKKESVWNNFNEGEHQKDKAAFLQYLKDSPEITQFLKENITSLEKANEDFKDYIKGKKLTPCVRQPLFEIQLDRRTGNAKLIEVQSERDSKKTFVYLNVSYLLDDEEAFFELYDKEFDQKKSSHLGLQYHRKKLQCDIMFRAMNTALGFDFKDKTVQANFASKTAHDYVKFNIHCVTNMIVEFALLNKDPRELLDLLTFYLVLLNEVEGEIQHENYYLVSEWLGLTKDEADWIVRKINTGIVSKIVKCLELLQNKLILLFEQIYCEKRQFIIDERAFEFEYENIRMLQKQSDVRKNLALVFSDLNPLAKQRFNRQIKPELTLLLKAAVALGEDIFGAGENIESAFIEKTEPERKAAAEAEATALNVKPV